MNISPLQTVISIGNNLHDKNNSNKSPRPIPKMKKEQ